MKYVFTKQELLKSLDEIDFKLAITAKDIISIKSKKDYIEVIIALPSAITSIRKLLKSEILLLILMEREEE